MTSPVLALRAAIRAACAADTTLLGLMDAAIHDEAPRLALPVYATFGDVELRDASTSTERGHEQELAILVWSRRASAAGGLAAAERLSAILDDAPLTLSGHRLVSLVVTGLEAGLDEETATTRVVLRLRAFTEKLP